MYIYIYVCMLIYWHNVKYISYIYYIYSDDSKKKKIKATVVGDILS